MVSTRERAPIMRELGKRNSASWLEILTLLLVFIGYVFPPGNWPDERRNLGIVSTGSYGIIYGPVQHFVYRLATGFLPLQPMDSLVDRLNISPGWRAFNGAMRYDTQVGSAPASYYVAKSVNVLIVILAVLVFRRLMVRRDPTAAPYDTRLFVVSLAMPSVCYQLMQISTDMLFLIMSVGLYFVRTRRGIAIYGLLAFVMVLEDRSFAILGATALLYAFLPTMFPARAIRKPSRRILILSVSVILGLIAGRIAGDLLLTGNSSFAQEVGSAPGFTDLSGTLSYTYGKSFSAFKSPLVFYAGMVYLPSAGEFLFKTIPLYLVAAPVFWRLGRIAVTEDEDRGRKFFYLTTTVAFIFFCVTGATHVFEHGRYYFTMAPLLTISAATYFGVDRAAEPSTKQLKTTLGVFAALNVILTLAVGVPTLL